MTPSRIPARALLLVPGGFALLAGLDAAALLLGLPAPVHTARLMEVHGILLVLGFVGTVIALERAVAVRQLWAYLAPAALGAAAVLLTTPAPRRLPGLELARVAMLDRRAETLFGVVAAATVAGTVAALLWPTAGYALFGAALLATTAWLVRYDIARRTLYSTGLPRYTAVCLLAGYGWLLVPASIWLLIGQVPDSRGYDAIVHAVMLGFVLSMIMAHAPVILPAVIRRPLPYTPAMYAPVALLHVSLLLRIAVGDARDIPWAVQAGGALNIVAVLVFVAVAVFSAVSSAKREPHRVAA